MEGANPQTLTLVCKPPTAKKILIFSETIRTNLEQLIHKFSGLRSEWEGPGAWTFPNGDFSAHSSSHDAHVSKFRYMGRRESRNFQYGG